MANINKETLLTQEYVKELFDYKDGYLYWKVSRTVAVKAGMLAGTENDGKYGKRRKIGVYPFGKLYASRLIYLWHHGWMPEFIDHEDTNPENNKIDNLRPATKRQNNTNCKSAKGSSSKYLGVSLHKKTGRWMASIGLGYKKIYLGLHDTEELAALAYNKEAKNINGEFAYINLIM